MHKFAGLCALREHQEVGQNHHGLVLLQQRRFESPLTPLWNLRWALRLYVWWPFSFFAQPTLTLVP